MKLKLKARATGSPKDALVKMLRLRDVSVAEARARLARLGVEPAEAEAAVAWAAEVGYLDDAKLAARLVERELARRPPPARTLIGKKLEARGLARELADAAVRAGAPAELVRERLAAFVTGARNKLARERLLGRLVRAGHAPDDVRDLIEAAHIEGVDDEFD